MADDKSRAYRSRNSIANIDPLARGARSDPLAELARLIGQSDPVDEFARNTGPGPAGAQDDAAEPGQAYDDDYAEPDQYPESSHEEPRFADFHPASGGYPPHDRDYDEQPSGKSQYARQVATFDYARDDAIDDDPQYREMQPAGPGRQLPFMAPPGGGYEPAEQWQDDADGQPYAPEEYEDDVRFATRRKGVVVIVAVLGLMTLGAAGAFAYRTMFGGSLLPSLPPIIKASATPNKIIPSHSDAQADASSQAGATDSSGEKLLSREEQPLNMQPPPSTAPRVISTIPVMSGPDGASQGAPPLVAPVASPPAAAAAPVGPAIPAPAPAIAPPAPAALSPAAASTAPKKIRTVIIRSDQSGGTTVVAAPSAVPSPGPAAAPARSLAPHPAVVSATRPTAGSGPRVSGANAPLTIVPEQEQSSTQLRAEPAASPRMRVSRAESPNTPLALGPAASSSPSAPLGGGYAVQVTSQRSQQEAQAAFRSLQAKFPNQLAGHAPIIRRVDLGTKGTFYRALVGPFASAEQAAALCGNLKSAGGTCVVQRD